MNKKQIVLLNCFEFNGMMATVSSLSSKTITRSPLSLPMETKSSNSSVYLSLHVSPACSQGGGEQPGQAIEFSGLDPGGPNPRVLVAEEHVAIVELHCPGQMALPEIRARESEVSIGDSTASIARAEQSLALEASGGAAGRLMEDVNGV